MIVSQKSLSACLIALLFFSVQLSLTAKANAIRTLTAPEAKNLVEKGKAVMIHTLSKIEFEIQYIPGSINIPGNTMESTDKLPADKNTPLIFYCMGTN